jgi:hypothetical protein
MMMQLPKALYLQCLRGYEDHLVLLIFHFCDVDVEVFFPAITPASFIRLFPFSPHSGWL